MNEMRIIPLGGVREFGLNSMIIEGPAGSLLIDAGLMFPRFTSTGIDQIIPDFSYVVSNQESFQGILITHGHEDHIGALPYLLKDAPIPVYGHPFALDLIRRKLTEYEMDTNLSFHPIEEGQSVSLAGMEIEALTVEHSTEGCFAYALHTPQGTIVHSGDFRYAAHSMAAVEAPVRLFICESTNAEAPHDHVLGEEQVRDNIEAIIADTPGLVITTTFSSHVRRIATLYDLAVKHGRRVAIIGRSMNQVVEIAQRQGYLNLEPQHLVSPELVPSTDRSKVMVICTGTQGEMYSVLALIARGWHKIKLQEGDTAILSARVIPGNEIPVGRCIDQLLDAGTRVFYPEVAEVHTSGHAGREELERIFETLEPEILMPVHGEFRHMKGLAKIARRGENNPALVMARPGDVWTLDETGMHLSDEVPHGKCFVDGELTGNIRDVVLRDRRHIAEGGLVMSFAVLDTPSCSVVIGPEIMCKGVVPASMEQELIEELRRISLDTLNEHLATRPDMQTLQGRIREELGRCLKARLGKKPMIVPILMEL